MYDKEYLEQIKKRKEEWESKFPEVARMQKKFVTDSEIPIKRIYTPLDVKSDFLENVNFSPFIFCVIYTCVW